MHGTGAVRWRGHEPERQRRPSCCCPTRSTTTIPLPSQITEIRIITPDTNKLQKRFAGGAQACHVYHRQTHRQHQLRNQLARGRFPGGWGDANADNLRGERSLDGFDVPQRLVIGSILDLPVGKGKAIGGNMSTFADKVVGGWGINTIITFQAGYPVIIGGCPGALSSSGIPNVGCARPTRTALSHLTHGSKQQKLDKWFDTSVFTAGDPNYFCMAPIHAPSQTFATTNKRTLISPHSKTRSSVRMAHSGSSSAESSSTS